MSAHVLHHNPETDEVFVTLHIGRRAELAKLDQATIDHRLRNLAQVLIGLVVGELQPATYPAGEPLGGG